MAPPIEPDFTLHRAARSTEIALLDASSASRLNLPIHHRELVRSAVRHLNVAQEELFKVANLPREKRPPKARQLSMETL
jgi:hypothetical protein